MSSEIYLVKINDVNEIQVQEYRSVRQQEVRAATDESEGATISDQFVGINMYQDVIHQSTRKRHSPTSYKSDFYK